MLWRAGLSASLLYNKVLGKRGRRLEKDEK